MRPYLFNSEQNKQTRWILFAVVSIIYVFFKFTFHDLWKDEWQAWLMARDMSWGELLGSLYYEGHPSLWYIYLKLWTYVGLVDEIAIQIAHSLVVLAAYYFLIVRMRFSLMLTILLLLGYYMFFGYGIVNRGYAFVMLFSFMIVHYFEKPKENLSKIAVILILLCQTEIYGVLMAGAFVMYFLLKQGYLNNVLESVQEKPFQKIVGAGLLGLLVFIITVYPRGDDAEVGTAYMENGLSGAAFEAAFQGNFVNTYWLGAVQDTNVFGATSLGLILSGLVLGGIIALFRDKKAILGAFLFFSLTYFLFSSAIYLGGVRQWGTIYIFFISLLYLWLLEKPKITIDKLVILAPILCFQIYYNALAIHKEVKYPFSNAQAVGEFIRAKVPANVPVIAINKFEVAPVTGYADRAFYALPDGEAFTYFKWLQKIYLPPQEEILMFADYKKVGGVVVISPKKLDPKRYPDAQLWKSFASYSIKNENYFVYQLKRK